ncbi:hypothetical protein [Streptomyces verrucosisporus]|uniref:hypothetical protein n=1 Tax=Streptomyces verrucosisporus TaxID=1695161 RepID=UPI001F1258AB|nr:hypothetical protein [Streptomyces verrucosisporus]
MWELAEHRSVFIERRPEHAGHALHTVFVDDHDTLVAGITARDLEPAKREACLNGVRKVTYRDPEGNGLGLGFGGAPLRSRAARTADPHGRPARPTRTADPHSRRPARREIHPATFNL